MGFPEEVDAEDYIRELENAVELLSMELLSLREHNTTLSMENETLKRKLLIYENLHTPPSRPMFKPNITNPPGKRGAPLGHTGSTRILDKPNEIIHLTVDTCPKCSHKLGSPIRMEKKTIFDILPPQKVIVTEYDVDVYRCSYCNTEVKAKHRDLPQKGDMGISLLNYITMLKYNLRGVIRRVQEFLKTNNDPDLSIKGINDAFMRVGEASKAEYAAIQNRIRVSKWVHIDETGFHVDGKKYWLWSFRSAKNDTLVVITDSRGRDVVKETMNDNFHGPVIVDGWKAYSYLTIMQRCWAHLIREVDAFKSSGNGMKIVVKRADIVRILPMY